MVGCGKCFVTCFLRVPHAVGLNCSCHAAQASKGNLQKTCYKTFYRTYSPRLYCKDRQISYDTIDTACCGGGDCAIRTLCTKHTQAVGGHGMAQLAQVGRVTRCPLNFIFFFSLDGLVVLKNGAFSFIFLSGRRAEY